MIIPEYITIRKGSYLRSFGITETCIDVIDKRGVLTYRIFSWIDPDMYQFNTNLQKKIYDFMKDNWEELQQLLKEYILQDSL